MTEETAIFVGGPVHGTMRVTDGYRTQYAHKLDFPPDAVRLYAEATGEPPEMGLKTSVIEYRRRTILYGESAETAYFYEELTSPKEMEEALRDALDKNSLRLPAKVL